MTNREMIKVLYPARTERTNWASRQEMEESVLRAQETQGDQGID